MTTTNNIEFQINLKDNFTPNAQKINTAADTLAQNAKKLNEATNGNAGTAEKNAKSLKDEAGALEQVNKAANDAAGSVTKEGSAEKQSSSTIRERLAAIKEQNIALKEKIALEERNAAQNLANAKNNVINSKTSLADRQSATIQAEILALEEKRVLVQQKIQTIQKEQEVQARKLQVAEAAILQSDEKKALAEARKKTAILQTTKELERQKTLEAQIEAEINKSKTALDRAANSAANLTKNLPKTSGTGGSGVGGTGGVDLIRLYSFGSLATQLAGLYASLRAIAFPVKEAAEFERALSVVRAIADATDSSFQNLTNTIIDMSTSTEFSATQIAKAAQAFAAAGYSVNEIVGKDFNALETTLQLAQVGMVDTAAAADILIKSLSAFGLPISDISKVGDTLAAAANATNVSVAELGVSLSYVAPIAGAMGLSLEEVVGPLAQLSNYGLKGSMAATALRGTFSALINPTKDEARLMTELGRSLGQTSIQLYDSRGAFIGLGNVMKQFEDTGLSVGEAMKLFGDRAGTGVTALMKEGSLSINEFIARMEAAEGSLKAASDVIGNNLVGDWNRFLATMSQVAIQIGSSAIPALSGLVQGVTAAGRALSSFIQENKSISTFIATVVTGIGSLAIALKSLSAIKSLGAWLVSDLAAMSASMFGVTASSKSAELAILGLTKAEVGTVAASDAVAAANAALTEANIAVATSTAMVAEAQLAAGTANLTRAGTTDAVAAAQQALVAANAEVVTTEQAASVAAFELAEAQAAATLSTYELTRAEAASSLADYEMVLAKERAALAAAHLAEMQLAAGTATYASIQAEVAAAAAAANLARAKEALAAAQARLAAGMGLARIGSITLTSALIGVAKAIGGIVLLAGAIAGIGTIISKANDAVNEFFKSIRNGMSTLEGFAGALYKLFDMSPDSNKMFQWIDSTALGKQMNLAVQRAWSYAVGLFRGEITLDSIKVKAELYLDKTQAINDIEQQIAEFEKVIAETKAAGNIVPPEWGAQIDVLKRKLAELVAERNKIDISNTAEALGSQARQESINRVAVDTLKELTGEADDIIAEATNAIKEKTANAKAAWEAANEEAAKLSTQMVNLEDNFQKTVDAASELVNLDSTNMKTALKNMWDNVFTGLDISKAEASLAQLNAATMSSEEERANKVAEVEAKIRELRISAAAQATSEMEALLQASSQRQLQIYEQENQKTIGVIKSRGLNTKTELAQIAAQEEKHAKQVSELAAQVAQKKKEGYETALKAAQQNLDAIYAKEKSIVDRINQLHKDKDDSTNSANAMIRDLERGGMSEVDAYNDKMAEINDNIAEGARLMQTDYASGLAMLKQAQSDAKGLGSAIKDGETDLVSQSDAISNATGLIKSAQDAILSGASAHESQLKSNLSALDQEAAATQKVADAYKEQLADLQNNQQMMININIDFQAADKKIAELTEQKEMVVEVALDYGKAKAKADELKGILEHMTGKLELQFDQSTKTDLHNKLKELEKEMDFKMTPILDDKGFVTGLEVMRSGWKETQKLMLDKPLEVTADMTEAEKVKKAIADLVNMPNIVPLEIEDQKVKEGLSSVKQQINDLEVEKHKLSLEDNTPEVEKRVAEIDKQLEALGQKKEKAELIIETNAKEVGKDVSSIMDTFKSTVAQNKPVIEASIEFNKAEVESIIREKLPDKAEIELAVKSEDFQQKLDKASQTIKELTDTNIDVKTTSDIDKLLGAYSALNAKLKEEQKINIDSSEVKELEDTLETLRTKIASVLQDKAAKMGVDTSEAKSNIEEVGTAYDKTKETIEGESIYVGIDSSAPKQDLKEIATMLRTELPDEKEVQIKMASDEFQEQLDAASDTIKNFTDLEIDVKGTDDIEELIAAFSLIDSKLREEKKLEVNADPEKVKELEEALDTLKTKIVDVSKEKVEVTDNETEKQVEDIAEAVEEVADAVEDAKEFDLDTDDAEEHLEGVKEILEEIEDMELAPEITPVVDADEAKAELDALCKDRTVTVKVKTVQENASGGMVDKFADGGLAFRRISRFIPGDGNKDDVPSLLMKGEYVLKKSAVKKYGVRLLDMLNNGEVNLPKFASGGFVGQLSKQMHKLKYLNNPKAPMSYNGVTYQLQNPTFINGIENRISGMQSELGMASAGTLLKLFNEAIPKMSMGGSASSAALTGIGSEASEIQRKYQAKMAQASASGQIEVAKLLKAEAKELKALELELKQTLKQLQQELAETLEDLAETLKDAEEDKKDAFVDASDEYKDTLEDIADEKADLEKEFAEKLKELEDNKAAELEQIKTRKAFDDFYKRTGGKFFDLVASYTQNTVNMRNNAERQYEDGKRELDTNKDNAFKGLAVKEKDAETIKKQMEQEAITVYVKAENDNKAEQEKAKTTAAQEKAEAEKLHQENVATVKEDTAFEVDSKKKEVAASIANMKAEMEAELMALRRKAAEAATKNSLSSSGGSSGYSRSSASGQVFWLNSGGYIPKNAGVQGVDSVPAMLTPGEMVIKAPVVDAVGKNFFDLMNAGKLNNIGKSSDNFPYLGKLDITLPGGATHNIFTEQDVAVKLQREVSLMSKRMARR